MASKDGSSGDSRRGLPAGRLPSLKGRQDLTLGGVPKRTFAPVIPVQKERNKIEAAVKPARDTQTADRRESARGARGHDFRGRGRGRGQDNFIQMKGIFQDVSKEPVRARSSYTPSSRGRSSFGGDGGDSVKRENAEDSDNEVDEEESKGWLAGLKRDDFVEYDHLETKDSDMIPVFLLKSADNGFKTDDDSKVGIKVKKECISDEEDMDGCPKSSSTTGDLKSLKSEKLLKGVNPSEMFTNDLESSNENFWLIQLPDVLPGLPPVKPPSTSITGHASGPGNKQSRSATAEQEPTATSFSLDNFSEGLIGKLQIRKSGRAQLVLGEIVLDIDAATDLGVLHDLVSINILDDSSGGDLSVLGHIKHKFICTADLEALLDSSDEARR